MLPSGKTLKMTAMLGNLCSHTSLPSAETSTSRFGPLPYSANRMRCLTGDGSRSVPTARIPVTLHSTRPINRLNLFRLLGQNEDDHERFSDDFDFPSPLPHRHLVSDECSPSPRPSPPKEGG